MSLISSLPFCVEEFESMDEIYDTILTPYSNQVGGPNTTGFKGSLFPLALTKEQVHALYWRLKTIELDYEVGDTVTDTVGSPISLAEVPEAFLGNNTQTAIIKRVCAASLSLPYTVEYIDLINPTTYETRFLTLFDYRVFSIGSELEYVPRCVKVENTYYPFFIWDDAVYGLEATTFGIESTVIDVSVTNVFTYIAGPNVTLVFPDSSTSTFQMWLAQHVYTYPPDPPSSANATMTTSGNWTVSLW